MTFSVNIRDRAAAEHDLSTFSSDLALVLEPVHMVDFEVITIVPQVVHAVMRRDHPLAGETELRLRHCLDFPYILPHRSYGVRALIEMALGGGSRTTAPLVESDSFDFMRHYVRFDNVLAFQIPIGLHFPPDDALISRPLSQRDVKAGSLLLGQKRQRTLAVAPARFAQMLSQALEALV